jgi:hypothetical protein
MDVLDGSIDRRIEKKKMKEEQNIITYINIVVLVYLFLVV